MTPRSVVIAHAEAMVAEGIAAALTRYPEIVPVGAVTTAADGERRGQLADAVAIDETLPGAARVAQRLRRSGVRVVFLGGDGGDDDGVRVSTRAPVSSLAAALVPGIRPQGGRPGLSLREREVLALVARGFSGKQIARHLGISVKTVERHKARIFAKLGAPNQAAAVFLAGAGWARSETWSLSTT